MSQNFLTCDLERVLVMPPSLADHSVEDDHLVWTVLGAFEKMALTTIGDVALPAPQGVQSMAPYPNDTRPTPENLVLTPPHQSRLTRL